MKKTTISIMLLIFVVLFGQYSMAKNQLNFKSIKNILKVKSNNKLKETKLIKDVKNTEYKIFYIYYAQYDRSVIYGVGEDNKEETAILKSCDDGLTWVNIAHNLNSQIEKYSDLSISIAPNNAHIIYVLNEDESEIIKMDYNGKILSKVSFADKDFYPYLISVSPQSADKIDIMGVKLLNENTEVQAVKTVAYQSYDSGKTLIPYISVKYLEKEGYASLVSLYTSPVNENNKYAVVDYIPIGGYGYDYSTSKYSIFKSEDGGYVWNQIKEEFDYPDGQIVMNAKVAIDETIYLQILDLNYVDNCNLKEIFVRKTDGKKNIQKTIFYSDQVLSFDFDVNPKNPKDMIVTIKFHGDNISKGQASSQIIFSDSAGDGWSFGYERQHLFDENVDISQVFFVSDYYNKPRKVLAFDMFNHNLFSNQDVFSFPKLNWDYISLP